MGNSPKPANVAAPSSRVNLLLLLAATVCLSSCGNEEAESEQESSAAAPNQADYGTWMSDEPAQWPQIVLTNKASFKGHSPLGGASGVFAENSKGEIFYGTVAHLLTPNGGVRPVLPL